jgi:hypothetical protein
MELIRVCEQSRYSACPEIQRAYEPYNKKEDVRGRGHAGRLVDSHRIRRRRRSQGGRGRSHERCPDVPDEEIVTVEDVQSYLILVLSEVVLEWIINSPEGTVQLAPSELAMR